jgi:hypothetical protein
VAYAEHLDQKFWLWMSDTFLTARMGALVSSTEQPELPSQMEQIFRFALSEAIAPLARNLSLLERKIDSLAAQNSALQAKLDAAQRRIGGEAKDGPSREGVLARASAKTRGLHLSAIATVRAGVCPCCCRQPIATTEPPAWEKGVRLRRFRSGAPASLENTWPVCAACDKSHGSGGFLAGKRLAFDHYQADLAGSLSPKTGSPPPRRRR